MREDSRADSFPARKIPEDLEKLQLLGRLVSGITHEINTPLHYLENNLTFLKSSFKDLFKLYDAYRGLAEKLEAGESQAADELNRIADLEASVEADYLREETFQALEQSIEGVDMVSRIVLALKDFSHPSLQEFSLTDINKCIDTACTISRHEWKSVAELQLELAGDLPFLLCSRDEIHQILLNLVVNAAHAIDDKIRKNIYNRGLITITSCLYGDTIEITVADDGIGIDVENAARIFQPHFTTKVAGRGTGFGLSLVKSIVEQQYGGVIDFSTMAGEGTRFMVRLPHRTVVSGGKR